MPTLPALNVYPFDPTGQLASNFIHGEQHTVTEANFRDYYFIVPTFAPFYIDNFKMTVTDVFGATRDAVEGQDYTFALPFMAGTRETGKPLYGALSLNQTLTNGILTIEYRALGGSFVASASAVLQTLAEKVYNPRTTLWDTVTNVPQIFPPSDHHQPADSIFGMQKVIDAIVGVGEAIVSKAGGGPVIGGGGGTTTEAPYYGIIIDKETVRPGSKISVQVIKDLVNSPETVYWSILHQTSTVLNFDANYGDLPLVSTGSNFKGSFQLTCSLLNSTSVSFAIAIRKNNSLGPIVAISDVITIAYPDTNSAKSGFWTGNNSENAGYTFVNDGVTGVVNGHNGELNLFAKNKKMMTVDGNTDTVKINYGPNSGFSFEYQNDGSVKILNSSSQTIWSSAASATTSYVDNKINDLVNGAGAALDTLSELADALGNDPSFATTILNSLNSKQGALGFTPVEQGTGIGQTSNTIKMGWSGTRLKATVDTTDLGNVVFDAQLNTSLGNFMKLDGTTPMTGQLTCAAFASNVNQNSDTSSLMIRNNGGTGDSNVAAIGFQCLNNYGIKMHLRADGYFGIGGLSSTAWKWYLNAAGDMTTAGDLIAYSDPRLKDDVELIDGAIDIVNKLDGVRFTWNNRSALIANKTGKRDIGVLADQVKAVLPEAVSETLKDVETGETYLGVAYEKLVPVLIEAIKELSKKVEVLTEKVERNGD